MCTWSSAHWQEASKLQPCGALSWFEKIKINGPINIVIINIINYHYLFFDKLKWKDIFLQMSAFSLLLTSSSGFQARLLYWLHPTKKFFIHVQNSVWPLVLLLSSRSWNYPAFILELQQCLRFFGVIWTDYWYTTVLSVCVTGWLVDSLTHNLWFIYWRLITQSTAQGHLRTCH